MSGNSISTTKKRSKNELYALKEMERNATAVYFPSPKANS